jgi:hypothetical protein
VIFFLKLINLLKSTKRRSGDPTDLAKDEGFPPQKDFSKFERLENKEAQQKRAIVKSTTFHRLMVKVIVSLYLMTQLEGFTYAITSVRVKPTFIDCMAILINVSILILVQLLCLKLIKRKSTTSKFIFRLIEQQFLHLSADSRGAIVKNPSRCYVPVILIQNSSFALKALTIAVTSTVSGLNVYGYCLLTVALGVSQYKCYHKNPNYESEIKLYQVSLVSDMLEAGLVLLFKVVPKS